MRICSSRAHGFSLIEILFALAIIGLALGAAAGVFRNGLIGHATASDLDTALALAEGRIAEAGGAQSLRPGETRGEFGRFRWRLSVARYDDREAPPPTLRLFRIEAQIEWSDGPRQRQFDVATLRLAHEAQ
ncbi:MAG TPA: prepilin-type N-terminal cleavage/methylation domain-containing protein [Stellaceae bacterium]|nr:prepilin-type N-terminal cleavage/methylation domain-containing protein [Stellaceae bacterium]